MQKPLIILIGSLVILLALEASAASSLTFWAEGGSNVYVAAGIGLYAIVGLMFGIAKKYGGKNLTVFNALWQMGNLAVISIIGVLFFKDKLTVAQWIGMGLAFAAALCFLI